MYLVFGMVAAAVISQLLGGGAKNEDSKHD